MLSDIRSIEGELLAYLRKNPTAGETLEGIVQWWLVRQRYIEASEKIREALQLLEQDGWVRRVVNPDGVELYFAETARLSE